MKRKELIKKYIEFFKSKDHKEIAEASLVPENNPTVLFTTAGMHPLVPFLSGQKHPQGKRLVGVQKCIRTGDIEEVGDSTHHTFFEMLGNWSLGDYDKKQAIEYSFEFLTKTLKIPKQKLAISYFAGDKNAPRDVDTAIKWNSLGISKEKIIPLHKEENWWGPAGTTGPCGPDTEMFYWKSNKKVPTKFNPNESTLATGGEGWVEIWNDVFMEYTKDPKGNYKKAKQKNIDTGMGVERTLAILNGLEDNYETELWKPIIKRIEKLSGKKYKNYKREMRIIADHTKAAVFILNSGIMPSNKEQGYVLRRLIRRAVIYGRKLKMEEKGFIVKWVAEPIFKIYKKEKLNEKLLMQALTEEENKFNKTLMKGLEKLKKMSWKTNFKKKISGKDAFLLFQSYGFPIEMTKEIAIRDHGMEVDEESFKKEYAIHKKLSQTASAGRFKSGLADDSKATTKLHTAAHLLLAAIRKVLKNNDITQKGSNINPERLRLDFSFDRKLEDKEIKQIENIVNKEIQKATQVVRQEMSPQQAKKQGALGSFNEKYGDVVSVYTIGNFSKEICTGPHVKNTKDIGKFKIKKQQSVGAGARRIKAVIE